MSRTKPTSMHKNGARLHLREGFTASAPLEAWGRTPEEAHANLVKKLKEHRLACPECIAEAAASKPEIDE